MMQELKDDHNGDFFAHDVLQMTFGETSSGVDKGTDTLLLTGFPDEAATCDHDLDTYFEEIFCRPPRFPSSGELPSDFSSSLDMEDSAIQPDDTPDCDKSTNLDITCDHVKNPFFSCESAFSSPIEDAPSEPLRFGDREGAMTPFSTVADLTLPALENTDVTTDRSPLFFHRLFLSLLSINSPDTSPNSCEPQKPWDPTDDAKEKADSKPQHATPPSSARVASTTQVTVSPGPSSNISLNHKEMSSVNPVGTPVDLRGKKVVPMEIIPYDADECTLLLPTLTKPSLICAELTGTPYATKESELLRETKKLLSEHDFDANDLMNTCIGQSIITLGLIKVPLNPRLVYNSQAHVGGKKNARPNYQLFLGYWNVNMKSTADFHRKCTLKDQIDTLVPFVFRMNALLSLDKGNYSGLDQDAFLAPIKPFHMACYTGNQANKLESTFISRIGNWLVALYIFKTMMEQTLHSKKLHRESLNHHLSACDDQQNHVARRNSVPEKIFESSEDTKNPEDPLEKEEDDEGEQESPAVRKLKREKKRKRPADDGASWDKGRKGSLEKAAKVAKERKKQRKLPIDKNGEKNVSQGQSKLLNKNGKKIKNKSKAEFPNCSEIRDAKSSSMSTQSEEN